MDETKNFELPPTAGFVEGEDYYIDENGNYVMTKKYLLSVGKCCKSGCKHCPYGFKLSKENEHLTK